LAASCKLGKRGVLYWDKRTNFLLAQDALSVCLKCAATGTPFCHTHNGVENAFVVAQGSLADTQQKSKEWLFDVLHFAGGAGIELK